MFNIDGHAKIIFYKYCNFQIKKTVIISTKWIITSEKTSMNNLLEVELLIFRVFVWNKAHER